MATDTPTATVLGDSMEPLAQTKWALVLSPVNV